MYYSLAYAHRARFCVVLGSGGGFVPSVVRQGQIDAGLSKTSRTVLIDGNKGDHGRPNYLANASSGFRSTWDVEVNIMLTDEAREILPRRWAEEGVAGGSPQPIDFLVIDADHTYGQSLVDAMKWLPLVSPTGWVCGKQGVVLAPRLSPHLGRVLDFVLTANPTPPHPSHHSIAMLHDTGDWALGCAKTPELLRKMGYAVLNFKTWGGGFALVRPKSSPAVVVDSIGEGVQGEVYFEVDSEDPKELARRVREICVTRGLNMLWGRRCDDFLGDIAVNKEYGSGGETTTFDLEGVKINADRLRNLREALRVAKEYKDEGVAAAVIAEEIATAEHAIDGVEMQRENGPKAVVERKSSAKVAGSHGFAYDDDDDRWKKQGAGDDEVSFHELVVQPAVNCRPPLLSGKQCRGQETEEEPQRWNRL